MSYLRLDEVCNLKMGQSPDSGSYNQERDGIPFFQGNADFGEMHPVTRTWCNNPTKVVDKGTLLISVRAPIGALNFAVEKSCIGRGLAGITAKNEYDLKYIYYALKYKNRELKDKGTGSTFKAISKSTLGKVLIRDMTIENQRECIKRLDLIYKIFVTKKEKIRQYDELIKSWFVEMFGTLEKNQYKNDIVSFGDVCSMIKDGTHQTPIYTENTKEGYKFLSSKDIMTQKIDWSNIKYIPADLHEKLYAVIKPQRNDILMSKNGVNYGVAAINDTDEIFDIYVSLALLRPTEVINPVYFKCAINNPDIKRQFDGSIKGIGVPNLHLKEIRKTRLLLPPRVLQDRFAAFVHQVDKLRFETQKALTETQQLFDSLMQKYFG
ncbi:MAG: hypothetical protein HFH19_04535 [Ruminococcus sp.]|jgi:type I restriction enzyme S subunit|nr:hypothetical protein [Ruminococcus sp.]